MLSKLQINWGERLEEQQIQMDTVASRDFDLWSQMDGGGDVGDENVGWGKNDDDPSLQMNEKYDDDFFLVQVGQLSLAHFEMYYLKTRIHKMRMVI